MRRIFDYPVRGKEAAKRLLSLHQGPCSVTALVVKFRTLAAESGLNNGALQDIFQHALNDDLRDKLARQDKRLRECLSERGRDPSPGLLPFLNASEVPLATSIPSPCSLAALESLPRNEPTACKPALVCTVVGRDNSGPPARSGWETSR